METIYRLDDHESLGTMSTSQTKEKSKLDEGNIYSKEVEEISSALKIKQNPDVREEIQIEEMESVRANFNDKDLPSVEDRSSFQLQKTEVSIDTISDSLFSNNFEELNVPNQNNEDELLLAADYSDSLNDLRCLNASLQNEDNQLDILQKEKKYDVPEIELIEKQLTDLQEYLSTVIDYNQNISEILPFDAKNEIARRCGNLQEQFDSTKQHAATTFTEVSGWIKKSGKIEDELRCLNASLQNEDNQLDILQKEKKYDVPEIEPLNMRIQEHSNKCETLCLYKQKFFLNWTGCQLENNESSLNWYKMMKLKVLQAFEIAKNSKYHNEDYQLSKELLNQLLHLVENQVSEQTYIENLDDLKKKKELLKHSMHSLETQLWIVKKNYEAGIKSQQSVTLKDDEDYHLMISKAEDVMKRGQMKYRDWEQKEIQFTQLDDLILKSSRWLHEKNQILKSKDNSKDLQNSYDILKDLQWDLSNFSHEIDCIKSLKEDITAHTKIQSMENSSAEIISSFKELHNSIDLELNKNVLMKEWTNLKGSERFTSFNEELKNIKHKLIGFRNILDTVVHYLTQDAPRISKRLGD
ncbi:nesprin-1 [Trichonephila inaurata madagascariensis]|uniref:Nesprin-1 n=1 Tax=Trichonephila inaurata madagascariensis TaxID=2747483 RepID=A0A8X6WRS9_9ARAC|nr:nesprin-1 [Trichonephila inaurata madagascariensis]